jgi:hypothetical protein
MFNRILEVARAVIRGYLGVKAGNRVLVICDQQRLRIADALAVAADELEARATIIVITENFRKRRSITEPLIGEHLREMVKRTEVAILCLANIDDELGYRRFFVRMIRVAPLRVANMPGITEETFVHALKAPDLQVIEHLGSKIARLFLSGKKAHVTSPCGTDIRFDLYGWERPPEISSGYLLQSSTWGNLPGAEVYIAPVAYSAEGKIVIDVTIDPDHRMKSPIEFNVHKGRVNPESIKSDDEEAKKLLLDCLAKQNGDVLCEFGIGLNREIRRIMGITLIDEKRYKTAHFALGDNIEFGGIIESPIHYDMIFDRPSISIDEDLIIRDGTIAFTSKELKNDYRDFLGRLPASTQVRIRPWATCVRLNGGLAQLWRGGANRLHAFPLGDTRTSKLAEKVWSAINHGGNDITTISSRTKISLEVTKKIVEFLLFHGALETFKMPLREEIKGIERMAEKKDVHESIELLGKSATSPQT